MRLYRTFAAVAVSLLILLSLTSVSARLGTAQLTNPNIVFMFRALLRHTRPPVGTNGTVQRPAIRSDNGFHMGEHRLNAGKQTAYEEDIRVPLIVRGPRVLAGQVLGHLTGNIDLAPTFAELGGASIPDFVDGRSLVSLLRDNPPSADTWRQGFLIEHWNQQRRETVESDGLLEPPDPMELDQTQQLAIPEFAAIRTKDYLYVEYVTGERKLYDLKADPYQLESLHAKADPALLQSLSAQLAKLKKCAGASCRE